MAITTITSSGTESFSSSRAGTPPLVGAVLNQSAPSAEVGCPRRGIGVLVLSTLASTLSLTLGLVKWDNEQLHSVVLVSGVVSLASLVHSACTVTDKCRRVWNHTVPQSSLELGSEIV